MIAIKASYAIGKAAISIQPGKNKSKTKTKTIPLITLMTQMGNPETPARAPPPQQAKPGLAGDPGRRHACRSPPRFHFQISADPCKSAVRFARILPKKDHRATH
jgi:hypothetical protein